MVQYPMLFTSVALTITDFDPTAHTNKECSYLSMILPRSQKSGLLVIPEPHKCSSSAPSVWQKLDSQAAFTILGAAWEAASASIVLRIPGERLCLLAASTEQKRQPVNEHQAMTALAADKHCHSLLCFQKHFWVARL